MSNELTRHDALLRGAAMLGSAGAAASVGPLVSRALAQTGRTDLGVLQLGLTLERLQESFYRRGAAEVPRLSRGVRALARRLADDEVDHIDLLSKLIRELGGAAGPPQRFAFGDAFSSQSRFLGTAQQLEEMGVSIYNGAAPLIEDVSLLKTVGSVVQVEARHAARIRLERHRPVAPVAFDRPIDRSAAQRRLRRYLKARG